MVHYLPVYKGGDCFFRTGTYDSRQESRTIVNFSFVDFERLHACGSREEQKRKNSKTKFRTMVYWAQWFWCKKKDLKVVFIG